MKDIERKQRLESLLGSSGTGRTDPLTGDKGLLFIRQETRPLPPRDTREHTLPDPFHTPDTPPETGSTTVGT